MEKLMKNIAIFSSAFIVVPAGRDILFPLYGLPLLEDGKMLQLMNPQGKDAQKMVWGLWGINHVFVSILKVIAVRENNQRLMKMLLCTVVSCGVFCPPLPAQPA